MFTGPAWALGGYIEPYLGYEIGDVEQGSSADDASGENLGFRLGTTNGPIFFGVEYALATIDIDRTGNDDEFKTKDLGAFIGYSLSQVRLWLTYWLQSEADSENANATLEGNAGYKLGLGVSLGQFSLNVEKALRVYDEQEDNTVDPDIELDGMLISISLPISF